MRIQLIIPGFENGGQRLEGNTAASRGWEPPHPRTPTHTHFIASKKKSRMSIQNLNKLNSIHNLDWQEPHSPLQFPTKEHSLPILSFYTGETYIELLTYRTVR